MQRSRNFVQRGMIGAATIGVISAGTGAIVVAQAVSGDSSSDRAVVTRIVDGDTFEADINGRNQVIRMLNIDTPETKDPNEEVQCLGPEASEYLAKLLPVGTSVTLEYDVEREDRYGRTLAGVFTAPTFVNAEMARAGLANPILIAPNERFYAQIVEARDQAAAEDRGLFSPEISCSLPAQVLALSQAVEQAPTAETYALGTTSAALVLALEAADAIVDLTRTLQSAFNRPPRVVAWAVLSADRLARLDNQVDTLNEQAEEGANSLRDALEDREREAAEVAAAKEAREARAVAAAAAREAREAAADEAPALPRPSRPDPVPAPAPAPDSGSGSNPYPGYTGPRCYAPGGQTWKPC